MFVTNVQTLEFQISIKMISLPAYIWESAILKLILSHSMSQELLLNMLIKYYWYDLNIICKLVKFTISFPCLLLYT